MKTRKYEDWLNESYMKGKHNEKIIGDLLSDKINFDEAFELADKLKGAEKVKTIETIRFYIAQES